MQELADVKTVIISQQKELAEVFTGFETANTYVVANAEGEEIYYAAEVGRGWLSRNFFQSARPFTIQCQRTDGSTGIRMERPFRFYFHRLEVYDSDGNLLGTVQRRFCLLRRIFTVEDASGNELCELFGPILHPWTFHVRVQGMDVGTIRKKWSGLGKEVFTDADNFGVTMPENFNAAQRAVLLGAVFLIDFMYFERTGR